MLILLLNTNLSACEIEVLVLPLLQTNQDSLVSQILMMKQMAVIKEDGLVGGQLKTLNYQLLQRLTQ